MIVLHQIRTSPVEASKRTHLSTLRVLSGLSRQSELEQAPLKLRLHLKPWIQSTRISTAQEDFMSVFIISDAVTHLFPCYWVISSFVITRVQGHKISSGINSLVVSDISKDAKPQSLDSIPSRAACPPSGWGRVWSHTCCW